MMVKIMNGYTFWGPENGSLTENLSRPWRIPSMITPPGLLKEMKDNNIGPFAINSKSTIAFYTHSSTTGELPVCENGLPKRNF